MVLGGDTRSEGHGFKSHHHILDGNFSHKLVVKIVMFVLEREAGNGPIFIEQRREREVLKIRTDE